MNTCKDCIFFQPELNQNFGECEKIYEQYGNEATPSDQIIFGVGGHYDTVSVGVDFGCIHFKEKEIKITQ